MILTTKELISFLRSSVNVSIEGQNDPQYLQMTDEDLNLYIKLGVSRAYPDVETLEELPEGSEYPVILLAKMELYTKLAVARADKVDMSAGDGVSISLGQRFEHYMKLIGEAREQYSSWLNNEGQGKVESFDVLLARRHYSARNFEKQDSPKVSILIDSLASDFVNFHWKIRNYTHFGAFKVYASEKPIFDVFKDGYSYTSKIDETATLVYNTSNIRDTSHSLKRLKPETTYYILVLAIEKNQVYGFKEVSFTTPKILEEEESVRREEIGG